MAGFGEHFSCIFGFKILVLHYTNVKIDFIIVTFFFFLVCHDLYCEVLQMIYSIDLFRVLDNRN